MFEVKTMNEKNKLQVCDFLCADEEAVKRVESNMPDDEILYELAELYKIFGDSTRIKILYALFESELCVCDIAKLLKLTVSAVSHQLRTLNRTRLVRYRREGKNVIYSLNDDHVRTIINQGINHIEE